MNIKLIGKVVGAMRLTLISTTAIDVSVSEIQLFILEVSRCNRVRRLMCLDRFERVLH